MVIRALTMLAALAGVATVVTFRDWARGVLWWTPKLIAGTLTPMLALVGSLAALTGLRRRDPMTLIPGLVASAMAARYIARVTRPQDGLHQAFGPGWEDLLPAELSGRMLKRRWAPLVRYPKGKWRRDLIYGLHASTGTPLLADLWEPPDGVPRSGLGIIYVHGGAWHIGDKDMGTRALFGHLTHQGHVILDVAYTLAPKTDLQGMLGDVKQAIRWLKQHGGDCGVRPDRIVLMGASAGGHLALLAAYTPNHPSFQPRQDGDTSVHAVVSFYGPPDLRAAYADVSLARQALTANRKDRLSKKLTEWMMWGGGILPPGTSADEVENLLTRLVGGTPHDRPDLYSLLSPIDHAGAASPPTLLLQGTADAFGMAPAVRELHAKLRQAGAVSVLVEFPDTEHAFDTVLPQISPSAQGALYELERFLALTI